MDDKMVLAFTKLIESGGSIAIWGILVWQLLSWIKILTVAVFVFLCVKVMSKVLMRK